MKNGHSLSVSKVLNQNSENFISAYERKIRQEEYGKNKLEEKTIPKWKKLLYYFNDPLMYVLLLASGLKFIVGSNSEAIIVLLVSILNALIGYYQEKTDASIKGISNLLSLNATIETENGKKLF